MCIPELKMYIGACNIHVGVFKPVNVLKASEQTKMASKSHPITVDIRAYDVKYGF